MRTVISFVAGVMLGCTSEKAAPVRSEVDSTPARAVPAFEVDLWPGEGIPVVQAVRANLPLRDAPDTAGVIVGSLPAKAGERIRYDSTRVQTLRPAAVRILGQAVVKGRSLGSIRHLTRDQYYSNAFPDTVIQVNPSVAMELLQYRAEGTCFVQVGKQVVDADPCPVVDKSRFAASAEPETLWWIRAVGTGASGWLLISDSTATVVKRTF